MSCPHDRVQAFKLGLIDKTTQQCSVCKQLHSEHAAGNVQEITHVVGTSAANNIPQVTEFDRGHVRHLLEQAKRRHLSTHEDLKTDSGHETEPDSGHESEPDRLVTVQWTTTKRSGRTRVWQRRGYARLRELIASELNCDPAAIFLLNKGNRRMINLTDPVQEEVDIHIESSRLVVKDECAVQ